MSAERKNWDKGEWADKARQRDAEAAKHAKARDAAMKEGELRTACAVCRVRTAGRSSYDVPL